MPKYQYHCNDCGTEFEKQQKFTDDPLTVCPECQGTLRKVFSAVGVVFKGSGFYKTDSRSANSKRNKASGSSSTSTTTSTAEPAATAASSTTASTSTKADATK